MSRDWKLGARVYDATRPHVRGVLSNYGPDKASVCIGPGRYAQVQVVNLRRGKRPVRVIRQAAAAGLSVAEFRSVEA